MSKKVDTEAVAEAVSAIAESFAGGGHARTASNVEGRTIKDADRSSTTTFDMPRLDSDVGVEEGWSVFNLEVARRDRVHFDNAAFDSRYHANEGAKHQAALWAQILDAQKLGTNNMWTASNELEQVVLAMVTKIMAENAGKE